MYNTTCTCIYLYAFFSSEFRCKQALYTTGEDPCQLSTTWYFIIQNVCTLQSLKKFKQFALCTLRVNLLPTSVLNNITFVHVHTTQNMYTVTI